MKATDIIWDVDMEDIYEVLDRMDIHEAAKVLELCAIDYEDMNIDERHEYAEKFLGRLEKQELMNLPEDVDVPDGMTDYDDISDWLSDEYGFCHHGFKIGG